MPLKRILLRYGTLTRLLQQQAPSLHCNKYPPNLVIKSRLILRLLCLPNGARQADCRGKLRSQYGKKNCRWQDRNAQTENLLWDSVFIIFWRNCQYARDIIKSLSHSNIRVRLFYCLTANTRNQTQLVHKQECINQLLHRFVIQPPPEECDKNLYVYRHHNLMQRTRRQNLYVKYMKIDNQFLQMYGSCCTIQNLTIFNIKQ